MTSPSPISAGVTRRVALGATGTGVLAALTACAGSIRPLADGSASSSASASASESASAIASASASPSASASASSSGKSYKGLVKFDNFEKKGEYVPATATQKAQNVPKPLVPANMNDQNVDGMYAFIGYWLASFNYAVLTGDMNYSPDAKIHLEGKSDQPFKTAESPNGKLMKAIVEYKDGKWFMLTGKEGSSASASSGSSSSV